MIWLFTYLRYQKKIINLDSASDRKNCHKTYNYNILCLKKNSAGMVITVTILLRYAEILHFRY